MKAKQENNNKAPLSVFEDNPFIDGYLEWMDTEEGKNSSLALDDVHWALRDATVDVEARKIIWKDGSALGVEETAKKIHKQTGTNLKSLRTHVICWLEMEYVPKGLSEKELERYEVQVCRWVDDYN